MRAAAAQNRSTNARSPVNAELESPAPPSSRSGTWVTQTDSAFFEPCSAVLAKGLPKGLIPGVEQ